jgi:FkbM family methyltransferase
MFVRMFPSRINAHLFLALCLSLFILIIFKDKILASTPGSAFEGRSKQDVNYIQDYSKLPEIHPYSCVRCWLNEPPRYNLNWTMCVKYPAEYISNQILKTGHWDVPAEKLILEMIRPYPKARFLDIGSNMGAFTTMVAATGQKVVAVDPSIINLAYIRESTKLFGTHNNVRIIQNAVSDDKMALYPWSQVTTNEGYIVFLSESEAKTKPANQIGEPVLSVKFEEILATIEEDTIVLKIDVEGAECKVLTKYLNSNTKKKFIPFIYMEWSHIRSNNFGLCPNIESLIQGFEKSGFYPTNGVLPNPTKFSTEKWREWMDVLWVHKDAVIQ